MLWVLFLHEDPTSYTSEKRTPGSANAGTTVHDGFEVALSRSVRDTIAPRPRGTHRCPARSGMGCKCGPARRPRALGARGLSSSRLCAAVQRTAAPACA